ncbi:general substrate transporter [Aspergillus heteromorphus CBS 117.55]|uniref:General substrate transporter n=1 Tax=Aspergillus heteromorphus CBS 117.55 TaxID=1448321 RepID=A0A317UZP0_9EURO|nr:general substrate transporter [Aspergillus heteromorphus CBS 117.55]PWY67156.1 general substrate transporter [Aspergillus heteromorphus CBS 117.55]
MHATVRSTPTFDGYASMYGWIQLVREEPEPGEWDTGPFVMDGGHPGLPRGVFNWYLLLNTTIFAFAGVGRGFDEGNIGSLVVQSRFRTKFGLDQQSPEQYANTQGWIVSMFTAGLAVGCLICLPFNDRLGRRWTLRLSTLVYAAGILGQGLCNGSLPGLYASRIVAGLGAGGTTVIPSMYISEVAPKTIRGLLTIQYSCCQQLGVVFGFFINYGVTKAYAGTDTQWMLPTLIQLLPAAIWGLGTFACVESPRWLLYVGQRTAAVTTLSRLRRLPLDHADVVAEIAMMEFQILQEREAVSGVSQWRLVQETFGPVDHRRRFFLVFMAHLFSQWSGANAITQYLPTILGYLGMSGETAALTTGVYSVVKFGTCLVFSLVVVDFVGRRRSLMTGITLQCTTLVYLAAYLGLIGSEVYPIRIRALAVSLGLTGHWLFAFGCSRATPDLLGATQEWGAFAFFAGVCLVSLGYVFVAMPDTTGRSLEALDGLFQRPWYRVYEVAYAKDDETAMEVQVIHEQGKMN